MDPKLLAILLAADHPKATEFPPGFDWKSSIARVRELKLVCDRIAGRAFVFDGNVQDASFFADIALRAPSPKMRVIDTVFALRFSCFGNLFTQYGPTGPDTLPQAIANQIVSQAEAAGFVFVP
jgi:hypothetical protein